MNNISRTAANEENASSQHPGQKKVKHKKGKKDRGRGPKFPTTPSLDQFRVRYLKGLRKLIGLGKNKRGQHEPSTNSNLPTMDTIRASVRNEVIWLELQAWHNDKSVIEQDHLLYETRQAIVPKVMSLVSSFQFDPPHVEVLEKVSSEVDLLMAALSQRSSDHLLEESDCDTLQFCPILMENGERGVLLKEFYISPFEKALDRVGKMLKLLCAVDNLYPSSSVLKSDHPDYADVKYQSKVESLCAWYNLVSVLKRQYSSFEHTIMNFLSDFEETTPVHRQTVVWPYMVADFDECVCHYTRYLLKRNSVKSILQNFVNKCFACLFRAKMNMLPVSCYSDVSDVPYTQDVDTGNVEGEHPRRVFRMLSRKRLDEISEAKQLIDAIASAIPDVRIKLSTSDVEEVFGCVAPVSPPSSQTAVYDLPHIQPLYAFFPVLLFTIMKHCMCLRLEQSAPFFQSKKPASLLTSRQLILELKEMLECASLSRSIVHFFMTSVEPDDELALQFKMMSRSYDTDLTSVMAAYLDLLSTWLVRVSCDLPHVPREIHSLLESEWEFVSSISRSIDVNTVLDCATKLLEISKDLTCSALLFLEGAITALCEVDKSDFFLCATYKHSEGHDMNYGSHLTESCCGLNTRPGVLRFIDQVHSSPYLPSMVPSDTLTSETHDVDVDETGRRHLFVHCRAVRDLFAEIRERTGRVLHFGECLRKILAPAIGFNFAEGQSHGQSFCNILRLLAHHEYLMMDLSGMTFQQSPHARGGRSVYGLDLGNYFVFIPDNTPLPTDYDTARSEPLSVLEKLIFSHLRTVDEKGLSTACDSQMQCAIFVKKYAQVAFGQEPNGVWNEASNPQKEAVCECDRQPDYHVTHRVTWRGKYVRMLHERSGFNDHTDMFRIFCRYFELNHDVTVILPQACNVGMVRNRLSKMFAGYARCQVGQMPVVGALKQSFTSVHRETFNLCKVMTSSVCHVGKCLEEQRLLVLEGRRSELATTETIFGVQMTSEINEVLQSCYNCVFDVLKAAVKVVSGEVREDFNSISVEFALAWMRYVVGHREKGKGVRPRWASQGLCFLAGLDQAHLLSMKENDFSALQKEIDAFMQHLIGSVPSDKATSTSPCQDTLKVSGVLRSVSACSSSSLSAEDQPSESLFDSLLGENRVSTRSESPSPMQRVRTAINGLEHRLQSRRYADRVVGRVLSYAPSRDTAVNLGPRTANFRWQRGTMIGQGAFGRVYSCVNLDSGMLLAMKEVKFQQNDHQKIKVALDEFTNFEGIKHRNLVQYYGVELHKDDLYIFMEFCDGGTLAELCRIGLPEPMVRRFTSHLLAAVCTLHVNGIIHRDIKGSNIFVTSAGIVKLGDFGSALKLNDKFKTATGEMVSYIGTTLAYTAPEVINASRVGYGRASDIWSVGCVVIEMGSGGRPWRDLETFQIMYKVGLGHAPPLPKSLSDEGKKFVRICTTANPQMRWSAERLMEHSFVKTAGVDGP